MLAIKLGWQGRCMARLSRKTMRWRLHAGAALRRPQMK